MNRKNALFFFLNVKQRRWKISKYTACFNEEKRGKKGPQEKIIFAFLSMLIKSAKYALKWMK